MVERFGASPDKKKERRSNPGLALALVAAMHGVSPAAAAEKLPDFSTALSEDVALSSTASSERTGRTRYEDAIDNNTIPLREQVDFIRNELSVDGDYYRALRDPHTNFPEVSGIYHYISAVSGAMDRAYHDHNIPKGMEKVFDVSVMERSTERLFLTPNDGTSRYCNGFVARIEGDEEDDSVAFISDRHCLEGTKEAEQYVISSDPRQDDAAKDAEGQVPDPSAILQFENGITNERIAGRITVSFSWDAEGKKKVDFSFVMPKRSDQYDTVQNGFVFLRPPEEAKILGKDEKTGRYKIGASGSSGSPVGVFMADGRYHLGGNLLQNTILEDTCKNLCYSAGVAQEPDTLRVFLKEARIFWKAQKSRTTKQNAPAVESWSAKLDVVVPKPRPAKRPRKD